MLLNQLNDIWSGADMVSYFNSWQTAFMKLFIWVSCVYEIYSAIGKLCGRRPPPLQASGKVAKMNGKSWIRLHQFIKWNRCEQKLANITKYMTIYTLNIYSQNEIVMSLMIASCLQERSVMSLLKIESESLAKFKLRVMTDCEWRGWNFCVVDITTKWAVMNLNSGSQKWMLAFWS